MQGVEEQHVIKEYMKSQEGAAVRITFAFHSILSFIKHFVRFPVAVADLATSISTDHFLVIIRSFNLLVRMGVKIVLFLRNMISRMKNSTFLISVIIKLRALCSLV